ncbi:hypothetical protein ALC56_04838 [Trachymyrmex septentrionalis]|uniref:Helix-turn-helix domain-containing protein n=1 Tax=Trachymyrmex septentrionalis TaxID=34720 RepID=A0A151JXW9_9HYME|nr:hypothetical protein ALC56_04838 [Trachymyrmex septentrionalis]
MEIDGDSLNFLDICLIKKEETFIFDWYRKPTFSGHFLNYFSWHPLCRKIGTIIDLINRVLLLSHPNFHKKNFDLIIKILLNNSYPLSLIFSTIKKRLYKKFDLFNRVDNFIILLINNYNIIYKIDCKDCDASYVEQTSRCLKTHISEHRNHINRNTVIVLTEICEAVLVPPTDASPIRIVNWWESPNRRFRNSMSGNNNLSIKAASHFFPTPDPAPFFSCSEFSDPIVRKVIESALPLSSVLDTGLLLHR